MLKETALFSWHQQAGAKLASFAGYNMPIQYSGIIDEHTAVRQAAGLFDVSHMGVAELSGPDTLEFLSRALTRDFTKLVPGKAAYTLLCLDNGGTVDDLIVYCKTPQQCFLVLNASNKEKDVAYLKSLIGPSKVRLNGPLENMALLALQGPLAEQVLERAGFADGPLPGPFCFFESSVAGVRVHLATTGYTGERGVEIFVENKDAPALWQRLLSVGASLGVKPVGLGARDTLRTEMGYSLYGHELSETINPIEAGLAWAVGFNKGDFVGKAALAAAKAAPTRKIISLKNASKQAPRPGMRVWDGQGEDVGEITSGTFSPTLGHAIGLALVKSSAVAPYAIDIRGTRVAFELTERPFFKRLEK